MENSTRQDLPPASLQRLIRESDNIFSGSVLASFNSKFVNRYTCLYNMLYMYYLTLAVMVCFYFINCFIGSLAVDLMTRIISGMDLLQRLQIL